AGAAMGEGRAVAGTARAGARPSVAGVERALTRRPVAGAERVRPRRSVAGAEPALFPLAPNAERSLTGADRDRLLAHGETLAAHLFAAALCQAGMAARAVVAGDAGLVTDDRFGAAHPLPQARALLREALAARPPVPVVTGFL